MIKVSVVVPVYNSGGCVDPLIESMTGQTLSSEEMEVVFVDDGSTDATPDRLEVLAKADPRFRLIRIPGSGWPGKPRNVGVAAARGEYVQFVDHDDRMAPDALRRLYEMGRRNGSDIVIGKVASNFRGVPHGLFETDREKCSMADAPLADSLTPHKMFRTAFLRENGIVHPEGFWRPEDQLFMIRAYTAAGNVSILGSYPCYYYWRREDGEHGAGRRIDPGHYYPHVREIIAHAVAGTEPGPVRDKAIDRFFRVEMITKVKEPSAVADSEDYLRETLEHLRPLAREHHREEIRAGLGAMNRVRLDLLLAGDAAGLKEAAVRASAWKARLRLDGLRWLPDGRLEVDYHASLRHGPDGDRPVRLLERDGRYLFDPEAVAGLGLGGDRDGEYDVTGEIADAAAKLSIRDRETAVEWPCRTEQRTELVALGDGAFEAVVHATAIVDIADGGPRGPLGKGFWDLYVTVTAFAMGRKLRLGADRDTAAVDPNLRPILLGPGMVPVNPYLTRPHANVTLDVDGRGKRLAAALAGRPADLDAGPDLVIGLDLAAADTTGSRDAALLLTAADGAQRTVKSRFGPGEGRMCLAAAATGLGPGQWRLAARLEGPDRPPLELGRLVIGRNGSRSLGDPLGTAPLALRVGRTLARPLPRPLRRRLARAARRVWPDRVPTGTRPDDR